MKATIKDVATLAGVSKSTVSQFVNGRFSYMSETTRKKSKNLLRNSITVQIQLPKVWNKKIQRSLNWFVQLYILVFLLIWLDRRFIQI